MSIPVQAFRAFLKQAFDNGDYATDDVIAFILPLCREVLGFHEAGMVAPFENEHTLFITENRLDIDERAAHKPLKNIGKVYALFERQKKDNHFEVIGSVKVNADDQSESLVPDTSNVHFNINEP